MARHPSPLALFVALMLALAVVALATTAPGGAAAGWARPSSDDDVPDGLWARARAALAQADGEIDLEGLHHPVEVIRDRWGVAHIYARTVDDLFFAQGFVAAQDRLWQMDLWRRAADGTLSEVLGPSALPRDTFARLIRYRGDMDAEWRSYAPDARPIIEAFVRGVNAQIALVNDNEAKLPIEFQLLGSRPRPWTPEVVVGRMAGYVMTRNARSEVQRAMLAARIGAARVGEYLPIEPEVRVVVPDGLDLRDLTDDVLALATAAAEPLRFDPPGAPRKAGLLLSPPSRLQPWAVLQGALDERALVGSNNWAVSGARSATGTPLLANDPHRAIQVPSLRYAVHLNGPGWNVIGAGEPALPGVAAGHNDRVAFGFTIVGIDQQDLYVERLDPADPDRYLYKGRWEAMRVERETVPVKGEAPRTIELRFTRHGPVLHVDRARHRAYALRWVGSQPGTAGYLASLSLNRARNWDEFLAALARWHTPPENLLYADVDGNIGWVAAGLTPVRRNWHGLYPVPGHEGRYEWDGFLPFDELPRVLNPPAGYLATANHNVLPPSYPHRLGYEWSAPHRYRRIVEVIDQGGRFDVPRFEALQHDELSLVARAVVEALQVAALQRSVPAERAPALRLLTSWDGELHRDSAAAALYQLWLPHLQRAFAQVRTRPAERPHVPDRISLERLHAIAVRPGSQDYDILAGPALEAAWKEARERLGDDPAVWAWGRLHMAHFDHPLASTDEQRRVMSLPMVPRGGDATTVNNTGTGFRQTHGASYRQVVDLADWDRSTMINVPGQSGQPGSPHYGDLLPLWARGAYHPMAFSREAVERHRTATLVLQPRAADRARQGERPPARPPADPAPELPPFAGTLVNFDRVNGRTAVCALAPGGGELTVGARRVRRTHVWVIEEEVLRQLGTTPGSCDPAWSPDGSRLAVVAPTGLWTYSPTLEEPRQLAEAHLPAEPRDDSDYTAFSRPRWSPDGRRIGFLVSDGTTTWVEAVEVPTGRRIFRSDREVYAFEWTSDPRVLRIGERHIRLP
jgi:penicillin G amidase